MRPAKKAPRDNESPILAVSPAIAKQITITESKNSSLDLLLATKKRNFGIIILESTIVTITVNNPSVSITAGCIATNYTLEAIPSENNVTFSWFKDNAIVNNQSANKLVVKDKGSYKVVINSDGCDAEAIENVTVLNCNAPIIPKGVSPNNDNLNDTFDLSNFNVSKLEIFNRYGIKVYSKSNYKNEWIGTSDAGQELPDGTYYYLINFNNSKPKTGWVYLNRQN
jgi:gliding motility-associated-like protein